MLNPHTILYAPLVAWIDLLLISIMILILMAHILYQVMKVLLNHCKLLTTEKYLILFSSW